MGAEQIGWLCKGPVKIPAGKVKAAIKACLQRRQELLDDAGADATRDERCDAAESATDVSFDPLDIPENPEKEIRAFVEWWHELDSRDTCSRADPDDSLQKIVYAGEMTWGDEPHGYGYQKLKQAMAWGFVKALGIR
jgi:hypothetical protein